MVQTVATFREIARRVTTLEAGKRGDEIDPAWPSSAHLVHRLAPDAILFGTFSHANLIVRHRELLSRSPSTADPADARQD